MTPPQPEEKMLDFPTMHPAVRVLETFPDFLAEDTVSFREVDPV